MAKSKRPPSVALEKALKGIEQGFSPFNIQKIEYRVLPNTGESVIIECDGYESDDEYLKWEKVDYALRIRDFLDAYGVKAYSSPPVRVLKKWGP